MTGKLQVWGEAHRQRPSQGSRKGHMRHMQTKSLPWTLPPNPSLTPSTSGASGHRP